MQVKLISPEASRDLQDLLLDVPNMENDVAIRELCAALRVVIEACTVINIDNDPNLYLATEAGVTITDEQGQDITVPEPDLAPPGMASPIKK